MNYQVIIVNDKIRNKNYYCSYVIDGQTLNSGVFSVDDIIDTITVSDLPPYQDINKARSCYLDSETEIWIFDEEKYNETLLIIETERRAEDEARKEAEIIAASTPTNYELAEASMETAQAVSDIAEAVDMLAEMLVMVDERLAMLEENFEEV